MIKNVPKVLICAPTAEVKDYCFDEWLENVRSFTYPNFEIFLADNSETKHYYKHLIKSGIQATHIKHKGRSVVQRMALSHEACRLHAISTRAEFMLHLESDVFPKEDIIGELLFARKRVVGAMYHIKQGEESELLIQAYDDTASQHLSIHPTIKDPILDFVDGTVKPVFHCGLGCMLIHRSVFKKISFRYDKNINQHPDSFWALDLFDNGITNHVHTGLICEHRNFTTWNESIFET